MSSIVESLSSVLSGDNLKQLSQHIGGDEEQTGNAIGLALPALVGALSKKASTQEGASQMLGAMERDQHGSILDSVTDLMSGKSSGKATDGDGILGHVFGSRRDSLERGISSSSGLTSAASSKLMKMLAPMVLGAIGKKVLGSGKGSGGLTDFLNQESTAIESKSSKSGFLGRLLDQDGDGDFDFSDIAKLGMGMLFKRK